MKKILFSMLLLTSMIFGLQAQEPNKTSVNVANDQKDEKYAEIKFDTLTHDFGEFSEKDPIVSCEFGFTNVGNAPLVIHQVVASCGCTSPKYTETPVKPGERGSIKVTYNGKGKFVGPFRKVVTVRYNSREKNRAVNLFIQGTMIPAEEEKEE